jgi:hypothetical protein
MCCRPKASFLIEDILQHSPTKTSDPVDAPWPTRPTPVYLNQVSSLHHTSDMVRMPTPTSATRGVYVSDGLNTEDGLRIHEYSHQRHSQPLTDPLMDGPPYRGMWTWSVLCDLTNTGTKCFQRISRFTSYQDVNITNARRFYILTNTTEERPLWQASNRLDSHEVSHVLRIPAVHYRLHKSPSLDPILSHTNPVHTLWFL